MSANPKIIELQPRYHGWRDVEPVPPKRQRTPLIAAALVGLLVVVVIAATKRPKTPAKSVVKPSRPAPSKEEMERRFAESDAHEQEMEKRYPDRSEGAARVR